MNNWIAHLAAMVCLQAVGTAASATSAAPPVFDSVEWSCQAAQLVVIGPIGEAFDSSGPGKSRGLISLLVDGHPVRSPARAGRYPISLRDLPFETFETHRKARTPLVFFLRETPQGYGFKGHSFNLWPIRDLAGTQRMVSLAAPGTDLVGAKRGALLKGEADVSAVCREAIAARAADAKAGKALKAAVWDVPAGSPLFRALGCKKACRVRVPETLPVSPRRAL